MTALVEMREQPPEGELVLSFANNIMKAGWGGASLASSHASIHVFIFMIGSDYHQWSSSRFIQASSLRGAGPE
jgi:hypothetical protein